MHLDVCLDAVYGDLPIEEKIARAAAAGYTHVEFWLPEGKEAAAVRQACSQHGVTLNNIVVNPPDGNPGGAPVNADDLGLYLERVGEVMAYAQSVNCAKAITCTGNLQPGLTRAEMRANLENALGQASQIAARHNFTLLLESLNTHVDHEGYYLDSSHEGAEIVRAIGSPHLRLLYDVYHMQIMEGNLLANIERQLDVIGHFHSAGVPGRHELFGCEINYPEIISRLQAWGYTGCFGLEYFPAMADHDASLREVRAHLLGE